MNFFVALATLAMNFSPSQMMSVVAHEATQQHVPPHFAIAIAKVESGFDPHMIGGVGEIGLMQIRPETAQWLGFNYPLPVLYEPHINAHYGVKYLSLALHAAHGNECFAAKLYNAGIGAHHPNNATYCHQVMAAERSLHPHHKHRKHRR